MKDITLDYKFSKGIKASQMKILIRELFAEFLGTFMLMVSIIFTFILMVSIFLAFMMMMNIFFFTFIMMVSVFFYIHADDERVFILLNNILLIY